MDGEEEGEVAHTHIKAPKVLNNGKSSKNHNDGKQATPCGLLSFFLFPF